MNMLRRLAVGGISLALCVGFGLADEIRSIVIKVDGSNVTFAENKGKGEKGPEKTLPVADNVKVNKGKRNADDAKKLDAGDPIEGGLKNDIFKKIDEKGLRATIITDADNKKIVEIRVGGGRKKKE
jgi:hypothetical protein